MIYKIRAILDVEKDVIRDILIDPSTNLETLHSSIANAFGFNGQEMASFYRTDEDWNQGEEIPLFSMSDDENASSMKSCILRDTLTTQGEKLIYVYDFLSMWTFFVELSEIKENTSNEEITTKVVFAFGETPETAPEKEFKADSIEDAFGLDADPFDEPGNFENIDDYDF